VRNGRGKGRGEGAERERKVGERHGGDTPWFLLTPRYEILDKTLSSSILTHLPTNEPTIELLRYQCGHNEFSGDPVIIWRGYARVDYSNKSHL